MIVRVGAAKLSGLHRIAVCATIGLSLWTGAARVARAQHQTMVSTTHGKLIAEERFVRVADTLSGVVRVHGGEATIRVRLELARGVAVRYESEVTSGALTQRMSARFEPDTVRVTFTAAKNTTTSKLIPVPDRLPVIVFQNPIMSILEPLQHVALPAPRGQPVNVAVFVVDVGDIHIWTLAMPSAGKYRLTTDMGLEIDVTIANGMVRGAFVPIQQFEAKALSGPGSGSESRNR